MKIMKESFLTKALHHDITERILIAEDIWNSIAEFPVTVPVSDSQRKELDRRLEAFNSKSGKGSSWDIMKKRIKRATK